MTHRNEADDARVRPADALKTARAQDTARKAERARRVVFEMAQAGEKITFTEVARRAHVSKPFLYNTRLREVVDEARRDSSHVQDSAGASSGEPSAMLLRLQGIGLEASRLCNEQRESAERLLGISTRLFELIDETQTLVAAMTQVVKENGL